jgi:hypothetical protein
MSIARLEPPNNRRRLILDQVIIANLSASNDLEVRRSELEEARFVAEHHNHYKWSECVDKGTARKRPLRTFATRD